MVPRINYTAHSFPNLTFVTVDCTNVSSFLLQTWDISGMPSLNVYHRRTNVADFCGTAITKTLNDFVYTVTGTTDTGLFGDARPLDIALLAFEEFSHNFRL